MSETMLIRPASPEADIPDPAHGFARLPYREEGVKVPRDVYWAGHLLRGDVVLVDPTAPAPEEPPAAEAAAAPPDQVAEPAPETVHE